MVKDFIPTTENVLQVCEAIATEEEQKIKDNADDILHWLIVCDRPVSMKLENVIASRFEAFRDKVIGILSQKDYENEENLALLEAVLRVFLFNLEKIDVREFEKELNILYSENSPIPQKKKVLFVGSLTIYL